jgi:hypothetical protein
MLWYLGEWTFFQQENLSSSSAAPFPKNADVVLKREGPSKI